MQSEQQSLSEPEENRKLYLPLEQLAKCFVCSQEGGKLKLCPACKEVTYCSSECQTKDWPSHKIICGKTDKIDLEQFYPYLAFLAEASRYNVAIPRHIAQANTVLRYPDPEDPIVTFPDQTSARLLLLGGSFEYDPRDSRAALTDADEVESWWHQADPEIRTHLRSRLRREGYVMPILFSICIGLMTDMYSTTALRASASPDKRERRRIRLQYQGSPISDFGLVKCKARVPESTKLAYYNMPNGPLDLGSDPNNHFALYFNTLRGEEVYIDLNLFPYNITTSVSNAGYTDNMPLDPGNGPLESAPVVFIDKHTDLDTSPLTIERKYSVLRNEVIEKATVNAWPNINCSALSAVMESILEKKCHQDDVGLFRCWVEDAAGSLNLMLSRRGWEKWPPQPTVSGGFEGLRKEDSETGKMEWVDFVQELCKRDKHKVIGRDILEGSFKSFKEQQGQSLESSRSRV